MSLKAIKIFPVITLIICSLKSVESQAQRPVDFKAAEAAFSNRIYPYGGVWNFETRFGNVLERELGTYHLQSALMWDPVQSELIFEPSAEYPYFYKAACFKGVESFRRGNRDFTQEAREILHSQKVFMSKKRDLLWGRDKSFLEWTLLRDDQRSELKRSLLPGASYNLVGAFQVDSGPLFDMNKASYSFVFQDLLKDSRVPRTKIEVQLSAKDAKKVAQFQGLPVTAALLVRKSQNKNFDFSASLLFLSADLKVNSWEYIKWYSLFDPNSVVELPYLVLEGKVNSYQANPAQHFPDGVEISSVYSASKDFALEALNAGAWKIRSTVGIYEPQKHDLGMTPLSLNGSYFRVLAKRPSHEELRHNGIDPVRGHYIPPVLTQESLYLIENVAQEPSFEYRTLLNKNNEIKNIVRQAELSLEEGDFVSSQNLVNSLQKERFHSFSIHARIRTIMDALSALGHDVEVLDEKHDLPDPDKNAFIEKENSELRERLKKIFSEGGAALLKKFPKMSSDLRNLLKSTRFDLMAQDPSEFSEKSLLRHFLNSPFSFLSQRFGRKHEFNFYVNTDFLIEIIEKEDIFIGAQKITANQIRDFILLKALMLQSLDYETLELLPHNDGVFDQSDYNWMLMSEMAASRAAWELLYGKESQDTTAPRVFNVDFLLHHQQRTLFDRSYSLYAQKVTKEEDAVQDETNHLYLELSEDFLNDWLRRKRRPEPLKIPANPATMVAVEEVLVTSFKALLDDKELSTGLISSSLKEKGFNLPEYLVPKDSKKVNASEDVAPVPTKRQDAPKSIGSRIVEWFQSW